MKDHRRDPTDPPPAPPRRAEWAGPVRLGTGAGIDPELIKSESKRENVLVLEPPMPIPKISSISSAGHKIGRMANSIAPVVKEDLRRAQSGGSLIGYALVFIAGYGTHAGWLDAVVGLVFGVLKVE